MFLKKGFYLPSELAAFGIPQSERTLENRRRGGAIRFGSGVPDLPTIRLGGRVVIAVRDLEVWLRAMGGLPEAETAPVPTPESAPADPATRRRPGRPRQSATGAGQ